MLGVVGGHVRDMSEGSGAASAQSDARDVAVVVACVLFGVGDVA